MIATGSPDFVWINTNEIISSWYLLGAVCVSPPTGLRIQGFDDGHRVGNDVLSRNAGGHKVALVSSCDYRFGGDVCRHGYDILCQETDGQVAGGHALGSARI
jgi:hypothetical protein